MNLTAILTKLGKFQDAVSHAKSAIAILESLLGDKSNKPPEESNLHLTQAIAYYNLGAAYEHMVKIDSAIEAYKIA